MAVECKAKVKHQASDRYQLAAAAQDLALGAPQSGAAARANWRVADRYLTCVVAHFAGRASSITVVDRTDPADSDPIRNRLVAYSQRLLDDGLVIGSAGNISSRVADVVAITPSGVGYRELRPQDICTVTLDGAELDAPETPSSETPMHLAVYAATSAVAIVHTHSPEVIALSAGRTELPAVHYAITKLGGPVRVAPYSRFGSAGLAEAAVTALSGRRAAILQNHGAICYGNSVAEAYSHALLLEWLARVYRLACSYGAPQLLSSADLAEVSAQTRRIGYGQRRHR
jgi:L-fuculose-phosphate aldolase